MRRKTERKKDVQVVIKLTLRWDDLDFDRKPTDKAMVRQFLTDLRYELNNLGWDYFTRSVKVIETTEKGRANA
jgi:hypothetical protein